MLSTVEYLKIILGNISLGELWGTAPGNAINIQST